MSRPTSTSTSPSCIEDVLQPGDDHGAYEFELDLLLDGSDNHCTTRPPTRRTEPLPKTPDLACATTQTKEAMEMPKVSRDSAPQRQEAGPVVDLRGELDGYTVSFTSVLEDIDATPLMKGLPDDRCPCPHWGHVLKGKMTARYADRDECSRPATPSTRRPVTSRCSTSPAPSSCGSAPAKSCARPRRS